MTVCEYEFENNQHINVWFLLQHCQLIHLCVHCTDYNKKLVFWILICHAPSLFWQASIFPFLVPHKINVIRKVNIVSWEKSLLAERQMFSIINATSIGNNENEEMIEFCIICFYTLEMSAHISELHRNLSLFLIEYDWNHVRCVYYKCLIKCDIWPICEKRMYQCKKLTQIGTWQFLISNHIKPIKIWFMIMQRGHVDVDICLFNNFT